MAIFLLGVKDKLESIQASSLVNIGHLARLLHYSLQSFIEEIMLILFHILDNPLQSDQVRRGTGLSFSFCRSIGGTR